MSMEPAPNAMRFRLSIPVKVALQAGAAYVSLWALGLALERMGWLDLSGEVLGIGARQLAAAVQIAAAALAATASTHLLIDKPLARLARAMSRAEEGDFLVRAPDISDDELGELARQFNRMLERITDLTAHKLQSEHDLMLANEQLKFRSRIEEKNAIIGRTNRALEHLVRDLSVLHEIGREVATMIELDDLYSKMTDSLTRHLTIHELAILIFDERREELHVKAAHGFEDMEAIYRTAFKKGEGITGLAAQTGRTIYIRNTSNERRFLHYKGERPPEASSFLSVPLSFKGEVLGVINFARRGVRSFSAQDVKMMSLVAGQVAIAIANAKLYTRTRELSVRDELTGINNRRHFQQMLQMEWKRAVRFKRELSLIMMDVDHFKEYNDACGHLQGDMALKEIGGLLRRNLREVDTVARFGGEEFVLLLPDTDKRGAMAVAEKVRAIVAAHRFPSGKGDARAITVSAGVSTHPDDAHEAEDLIDHADIALYRAKENGRNRTECYPAAEAPPDEEAFIPPHRRQAEKKKRELVQ